MQHVFLPVVHDVLPSFLYALDLIGVSVFAISGALAAGRKRLDLIGVMVLALVTAVGGGTIRDVLLARHPIFWLADQAYLIVIISSALLTVAYVRWRPPPRSALLIADAFGLALFSIVGAQIAEQAGLPAVSGMLLGTVTGAAGGVVRDVLSTEIPLVLQRGNLYATAAIIGTGAYFALESFGVTRKVAALAGMAVIVVLRLAALRWEIQVPAFELATTQEHPAATDAPPPRR
jgi:uncharacterized membrane protein YeiH